MSEKKAFHSLLPYMEFLDDHRCIPYSVHKAYRLLGVAVALIVQFEKLVIKGAKAKNEASSTLKKVDDKKIGKTKSATSSGSRVVKKRKKDNDPSRSKRPPTAFFVFMWLQSAGLQHLASASTSSTTSQLSNPFTQGYDEQAFDDKQRLFKMLRSMNLGLEPGSEPYTLTSQSSAPAGTEGFLLSEFRGEFDDTELFSEA